MKKKKRHVRRHAPAVAPAATLDPIDVLARELRMMTTEYELRASNGCEPGCPCSLHQLLGAARRFLDDYDRFHRGELVMVGIPFDGEGVR